MADQDWVDVDINESDWVDVPNEKPSLLNRAAQFITKDYPRAMSRASTDIASGFGRGVASLMPSSKALATAVMPVRPNEISALLAPLLSKIKSPVENLPAPEGIRGQLLQGAGSLAPTLIPMQKGLGLIEGPAQKLIEKIPQSKLRGLLSTIARPAVGFGGYEAGKGLLTEEAPTPVRSAIEGMKTGALFGAAGRVGEKLLPGAAGRALGGGAGMAITAPEGERASGFITGATLGAGAETPRDIKAYQIVSERAPKIIRPTVSGKQTGRDIERYNKSVSDAFIDIVDNKADLGLTDAFGNPVSRTPRNVDETLDGIRNLKQKKYDAYNSMQKNAGEAGAIVSTEPLVQELAKFATDPAISKFDPSGALQGYAKQMAEVYAKGIDTGEAQRILELINAKTKGKTFASPNDQSKLAIDQLVANHLRKGLDSVITETEGAGYSKLRKDYSNLLKLEKDLTKRNIVFKRRSQSGFFDLSDVYTAKEMVQGILTGNAQQTLAGAAGFGTKMLLKMRNNPDVQIRDLFKDLDRSRRR